MALKLIQAVYASTYGIASGRSAKFYRDAEWDEYRVKFFQDGAHLTEADYHDTDKESARDTMFHWIAQPATVVVEETGEEMYS